MVVAQILLVNWSAACDSQAFSHVPEDGSAHQMALVVEHGYQAILDW